MAHLREVSVLITDDYGHEQWVPARPYQKEAVLDFFERVQGLRNTLNYYQKEGFSFENYRFDDQSLMKYYEMDKGEGHFWIKEGPRDSPFKLVLIRSNLTQMHVLIHHDFDRPYDSSY
jgi:hypothetical protein